MKRIGILETGHNSEPLEARFGRFADAFERWLAAHRDEFPVALDRYWVENGELPPSPDACHGYIITGSAAGVYEDHAWLEPARAFIRDAMAAERRLLGVCFGHQLIADALGGKVVKSDKGWGIGRHTYALREPRPWMDPALRELSLLACHQDQVVEPPPGAQVLASSPFCEYAMLAYGDPEAPDAISIQPHPEFGADYTRDLIDLRAGVVIPHDRAGPARSSLGRPVDNQDFASWCVAYLRAVKAARDAA